MDCIFSILVCSLKRRQHYLDKLLACVNPQLPANGSVELLVDQDEGEVSIGDKRNRLLEKAKGKMIAFIDDDDLVSPNYVAKITEAIKAEPNYDVIGISLVMTTNGIEPQNSYHSTRYTSWWDCIDETTGRKKYFRNPNHLNPVKRELALKVKFPSKNHGEDRDYSAQLLPLLKSEFWIDEPMYYYQNRYPKEC